MTKPPPNDGPDERPGHPLFKRFSWRLYRWLLARLRNPGTADTLAEQVLARASRVERAKFSRNPFRWLITLARHFLREAARQDAQFRPPNNGETATLSMKTAAALERLSPEHRAVILLCKRDGLTLAQAAARLNVPVGTVAKRLHEARAQIALLIDE